MGFPDGIGVIDTMVGFPHADMKQLYAFITPADEGPGIQGEF